MADIARRIKLYNQAFQLAHEHVANDDVMFERPDVVKALHDLIRREIAVGIDDPSASPPPPCASSKRAAACT